MAESDIHLLLLIAGMTAVTVASRAFFFMVPGGRALPEWLNRCLRYAPVAALAAVIVPELLPVPGLAASSWHWAKPLSALAACAWFAWRRDVLGTIFAGLAVYVFLHLFVGI